MMPCPREIALPSLIAKLPSLVQLFQSFIKRLKKAVSAEYPFHQFDFLLKTGAILMAIKMIYHPIKIPKYSDAYFRGSKFNMSPL